MCSWSVPLEFSYRPWVLGGLISVGGGGGGGAYKRHIKKECLETNHSSVLSSSRGRLISEGAHNRMYLWVAFNRNFTVVLLFSSLQKLLSSSRKTRAHLMVLVPVPSVSVNAYCNTFS